MRAGVGTATIQRIEHANFSFCGQHRTVDKLEQTLIEAGVRFVEGPAGEIGVQIKPQVTDLDKQEHFDKLAS